MDNKKLSVQTAKEIIRDGKIFLAVKAFGLSSEVLSKAQRNAAGDPPDYFDYVMLAWSNVNSGYRLVMERYLDRNPNEKDLNEGFVSGVSFHFRYDDIIKHEGYVFDGYHPAKIKDSIDLDKMLHVCVIPEAVKEEFKTMIPRLMENRVVYIKYDGEGLVNWNKKVYESVSISLTGC